MKIRSYKGRSLEHLHDTIHKELGPDAIIVHSGESKGIQGLFGKPKYEIIAVTDDNTATSHLLSGAAKSAEIDKLSSMQTDLKSEIEKLTQTMAFPGSNDPSKYPRFTKGWDFRFIRMVQSRMPELLDSSSTPDSDRLSELINIEDNFSVHQNAKEQKIIVLTGPTGSGKTTTLAKLAAGWCIDKGLNVGLITTDTFRVAAVDQAKEYATLLGLDLQVAFSAREAARSVKAFADKDVILVDTPGRSHHDKTGMASLKGTIEAMGNTTVLLTIPAGIDRHHIPDIIRKFNQLKPSHIVLTKTDETEFVPMITTLSCETGIPIAFITDGQRVPQDIHKPTHTELIDMIMGTDNEDIQPEFIENHSIRIRKEHTVKSEPTHTSPSDLPTETIKQIQKQGESHQEMPHKGAIEDVIFSEHIEELKNQKEQSLTEMQKMMSEMQKEIHLQRDAENKEVYVGRILQENKYKQSRSHSKREWFLRTDDRSIFGPIDLDELYNWVSECRIKPYDRISRDKNKWRTAHEIHELEMDWILKLSNGEHHGPINLPAVYSLISDGLESPIESILNRKSGELYSDIESLMAHNDTGHQEIHKRFNLQSNNEYSYEIAS